MLLFNKLMSSIKATCQNFNTSNVTIQRPYLLIYALIILISIHLMLLFNLLSLRSPARHNLISIHLMLLFNPALEGSQRVWEHISIHLMLLFNYITCNTCSFYDYISIHLMLLFNMDTILEHYIIHQYFNTSNVTIQRNIDK